MNRLHILVIDDDHMLASMIELALGQLGDLAFRYAHNGQHGAEIALAEPPDVILLDFEMPVMDGLDTLRHLRASDRTARTPVVAITGSHRNAPRCAAMIAECDAYLPKPFKLSDLRRAVLALLNPRAQEPAVSLPG